jgi:hypothetical protein
MNESKLSTADFVGAGQVNSRGAAVLENEEAVYDSALVENTGGAQMVREPALPQTQTALFPDKECHDFRSRWDEVQIHFVDDPRKAVEKADNLVADTMQRLAEIFSEERKNMETQWSRGENVSTEDLRLALQRYRSFFNRLLLI